MMIYGGADLGFRTLMEGIQPALVAVRDSDLRTSGQAALDGAEATA
ncbi:hypothetical protein ACVGW2_00150 [Enterobacter intestinihominis]